MNGPVEPAGDYRIAANTMRQMYLALIQEGFTESEALKIVGHIIAASMPE